MTTEPALDLAPKKKKIQINEISRELSLTGVRDYSIELEKQLEILSGKAESWKSLEWFLSIENRSHKHWHLNYERQRPCGQSKKTADRRKNNLFMKDKSMNLKGNK